jgi:hypothetical protein
VTKRNLIIIHRGPEYERDFDEITSRVIALDRDIITYHLPAGLSVDLPESTWQRPTLTVALTPKFKLQVKRGRILKCRPIGKLQQQEILRSSSLPTPPAARFEFGMKLDPIMFGEFVLLKPLNPRLQSKGQGVHVMRRSRVEALAPRDVGRNHPILHDKHGYIVQKFISTGEKATTYRVATFLGSILFSAKYQSNNSSPSLSSPDTLIESGDFTQKGDKTITFEYEEDILSLARKVAPAFEDFPLLGVDFVRDCKSSKLYVLEVNPGGNTWHFSSSMWAERRRKNPELALSMKDQLGAFDVAAKALVEKTRLLAT